MIMSVDQIAVYIITALVAFLGVYIGALLAFFVPEETKHGQLYFRALQNSIIIGIIAVLMNYYKLPVYGIIAMCIFGSLILYLLRKADVINQITYFLMGIALYLPVSTKSVFAVIASLIFLYGLPTGSIYVSHHPNKSKATILGDMTLAYCLFFVVAMAANILGNLVF